MVENVVARDLMVNLKMWLPEIEILAILIEKPVQTQQPLLARHVMTQTQSLQIQARVNVPRNLRTRVLILILQ